MTPNKILTLDQLPGAFEEVRGEVDDKSWAQLVIGRFTLDNVNHALIAKELTEVLKLVRTSGESPRELFGEAFDYVATQTEQWRADGAPIAPVEPATGWRDVPALSAVTATLTVFLFLILEIFAGNWTTSYTLGKVLMPILTGISAIVTITAFESLLMRTRRLWAVTGAVAMVVVSAAIIVSTFILGNMRPLFTGSLWWYAVLVAVHALIAFVLVRYVPDSEAVRARNQRDSEQVRQVRPDLSRPVEQATDHEWVAQLAGVLRLRVEMSEKEVQATITDARGYAAAKGTSLSEEFGTPAVYASRLPRPTKGRNTRERWRRVAWIVAVPAFGYLAFEGLVDGLDWSNVRWLMVIAFAAACLTVVSFIGKPLPPKR
ncbi:hypothetical protein [Arthrobacter flavus]|uniref:Uncharacterized protein n=1 Tax=Arthrobacter flavus TaxID=95172 RepID=A0ABW4Q7V4_9MICC